MNNERLQQSNEVDKQRPPYEMKIIILDGENAIRNLLFKQRNYNPDPVVVDRMVRKLIAYLEESYGSIANVRLFSSTFIWQKIMENWKA